MTFPQIDGLRAMELATPGPLRARLVDLVVTGQTLLVLVYFTLVERLEA